MPIDRLATTFSSAYDPAEVSGLGGGRLTRLVEHAPPATHQAPTCQGRVARSNAEEVSADAERVRAHRDRGRQGRPCRPGAWWVAGVQLAEDITGPYDVIATIQAPSLDQLGRLVVSRIQVVDGVTRTLTCMVLHR
jgi:DNA-binding Lrp family transcriptional regulator